MERRLILIIMVFFACVAVMFCTGCTDEEKSDEIFKRIPTLNTTPGNVQDTQPAPAENVLMIAIPAENGVCGNQFAIEWQVCWND